MITRRSLFGFLAAAPVGCAAAIAGRPSLDEIFDRTPKVALDDFARDMLEAFVPELQPMLNFQEGYVIDLSDRFGSKIAKQVAAQVTRAKEIAGRS